MLRQSLFFLSFLSLQAKEILVVAPRILGRTHENTQSVKVFDRRALDSSQAQTLGELLTQTPGVHFQSNGAFGKSSSLFIRGTDNRHALILIDGVAVGDPTAIHGSARVEFISLENVERVEILKGSQGVLYGSSAIGGVIKITTQKGGKEREGRMSLGYGQHDNRFAGLSLSGGQGKWDYALSGNYRRVEGISSYPSHRTENADHDSFLKSTLDLSLGRKFGRRGRLGGGYRLLKSAVDFDEDFRDNHQNHERYFSQSWFLTYSDSYGKMFNPRLLSSTMAVKRNLSLSDFSLPYKGEETILDLTNTSFYGKNNIILGLKYTGQKAQDLSADHETVRDEFYSFYTHNTLRKGRFFSHQGLRLDQFKFFGQELTYSLGTGVDLDQTTLRTTYSTGLKSPSLFTAHGPFGGGPQLRAESSKSFEVGLVRDIFGHKMALTYFHIDYKDYIDFIGGLYRNTGGAKAHGLELDMEGNLGKSFRMQIHSTLLDAKNKETGHSLLHRPRLRAGLILDYFPHDRFRAGVDIDMVGQRESIGPSARVHLPSHYLLSLRGTYHLNRFHRIQVKVGNLMNRRYEEVAGYASLGRAVQAKYTMTL